MSDETRTPPNSALGVVITAIVSVLVAICIEEVQAVRWWHPYCDQQVDGPGYWATGFPLPYLQLTGGSSMEYSIAVPAYAVNVAGIALLLFFVLRFAAARLRRPLTGVVRASLTLALIALLSVDGLIFAAMHAMDWPTH